MRKENILRYIKEDETFNKEILISLLDKFSQKINIINLVDKVYSKNNNENITKKEIDVLSDIFILKKEYFNDKTLLHFIGDILSYVLFFIIFSTFIYLIIIGQSRATIDFQVPPYMVLLISFSIIFFLALLEGSQLAIVHIANKDLSSSFAYPIAYEIQKMTRTKTDIQSYLIGRQLLVVIIVTVFSLLISFPEINHQNFIYIPIIIDTIFFKLGLINALLLLWLGQLIPQLIATKAPQTILNFRIVKYIVLLSLFLAQLKIAKPSSLIADIASTNEIEPLISNYDNFIQNKNIYKHYYEVKNIEIEYNEKGSTIVNSMDKCIVKDKIKKILWQSLSITGNIKRHSIAEVEVSNNDKILELYNNPNNDIFENNQIKRTEYSTVFEPLLNNFSKNDELKIFCNYEVENLQKLNIKIDKPCRVVFIRFKIPIEKMKINKINDFTVTHYKYDQSISEYIEKKRAKLDFKEHEEFVTIEYAKLYPEINSVLSFSWNTNIMENK